MSLRNFIFAAFLLCALPALGLAQGAVFVRNFTAQDFPLLKADILAFDSDGRLVENLSPTDVSITENGVAQTVTTLSCVQEGVSEPLSSVLVVDISSSMGNLSPSGISLARSAAASWTGLMAADGSEVAVAGFDHLNYLYQDFTDSPEKLLKSIYALQPKGARDYDAGFLKAPAGGFDIIKRGKHKRIMIFITNGPGGGTEGAVIEAAQQNNVEIYVIGIQFVIPEFLKNIAAGTGGEWFDNIRTVPEAESAARYIMALAQGGKPCRIEWQSQPDCFKEKSVVVSIPLHAASGTFRYMTPQQRASRLVVTTPGIDLSEREIFPFKDTAIAITAENGDIEVSDITTDNPAFTIADNEKQFVVKNGEIRTVNIRYTPVDSAFSFSRISFISNACTTDNAYIRGGFAVKTNTRLLKVVSPNGSEQIASGSTTRIIWTGVLPQDTVIIEYSADGGEIWKEITDTASGLSYEWQTPDTISTQTLVRIREKHRLANTWRPLRIIKHKTPVQRAILSPDGNKVLTLDTDDNYGSPTKNRTARLWDATTGKLLYILPDSGRVRAVAYSRSGKLLATTLSDTAAYNIIDAETGKKVSTGAITGISKQYASIWSIDIHPNDDQVVLGEAGGEVHFQNIYIASDPFKFIQNDRFFEIRSVRFNADGSRLIVSGDTISIYTIEGNSIGVARSISMNRDQFGYGADISADGTNAVVSVSANGVINPVVWDIGENGSQRIFTMPSKKDFARSNRFSWDGKLLVTGAILNFDTTNIVQVFDVESGSPLATLSHHTNPVLDACFSADSRRIASASVDSTVIIWEKSPEPDSSDAYFSLVSSQLVSRDVDFGRVLINASKDSVFTSFLCNFSDTPLLIDSIDFLKNSPEHFFTVISEPRYMLDTNSCVQVGFRFAPSEQGIFVDTIRIFTPSGVIKREIRGESVKPLIDVAGLIDFGRIFIGNSKDSLVEISIINHSPLPVSIADVVVSGPDTTQFSIVSGREAFVLAPNESHALKLRFSPDSIGRTSSGISFVFKNEPAQSIWPQPEIQLFGEGICAGGGSGIAAIQFSQPSISTRTGQTFLLPLKVIPPQNSLQNVPRGFTATLRFDKTVLLPVFPTPAGYIDGDERVIPISGKRNDESDVLAELRFTAALGDTDRMFLKVEDFEWEDCGVAVETFATEVFIENICETDGAKRFFKDTDLPGIFILQNPFSESSALQYRLIEPGPTEIFLVNSAGQKIPVVNDKFAQPGVFLKEIIAPDIAAGMYFVVLKTPTQTITERIIKLR